MSVMSRAVTAAAVLTTILASTAVAQRRAPAAARHVARHEARLPVPQQPATAMTGPEWSLFGGIASGDGAFDLGVALGGSGRWRRADWPVAIRGDAYFAHHGGDLGDQFGGIDISTNILGVMGNAEYAFPTTGALKPYAFGGLGLFYQNSDVDEDDVPGYEGGDYDSSLELGIGFGGGLRFTPHFGVELRVMDIGGFTTIPIVAVIHF